MFDVTKYKSNILEAAREAGAEYVSIAAGSLREDYEPTLYISCWSKSEMLIMEEKFIDSLLRTIPEDFDWLVVAKPPAVVREVSGVLLVDKGVWCYE